MNIVQRSFRRAAVTVIATVVLAAQTTSGSFIYPLRSSVTGLVGYVDRAGKYIIEPTFEDCDYITQGRAFFDGLARVGCGPFGYINSSGKLVIPYKFDEAADFSEGVASVGIGGKYGYIDKAGTFVVTPRFDCGLAYSEGLAAVCVGNLFGYIDKAAKFVVPPSYEVAGIFSNDLAPVRLNKKFGYINKSGTVVLPPSYEYAGEFSGGLAVIKLNGKYGYIDSSGQLVIEPRYELADKFVQGFAPVTLNGKAGFINKAATMVIPAIYERAFPFQNDMALVQVSTLRLDSAREHVRFAYIDQSGQQVMQEILVRMPKTIQRNSAQIEFDVPRLAVKIHSSPPGAKVWLIPLETVDSDPDILHNQDKLLTFLLPAYTPVDGEKVIEQVFVAILQINGKSARRIFDVNESHENKLEVDFAKEQ
jgi:hypothetical protein